MIAWNFHDMQNYNYYIKVAVMKYNTVTVEGGS